jgi:hypothetical protein
MPLVLRLIVVGDAARLNEILLGKSWLNTGP